MGMKNKKKVGKVVNNLWRVYFEVLLNQTKSSFDNNNNPKKTIEIMILYLFNYIPPPSKTGKDS